LPLPTAIAASPFLIAWAGSPWLIAWLNRPVSARRHALSDTERENASSFFLR